MADNYTIVRATDEDDGEVVLMLRDLVQMNMNDGWIPSGGVVIFFAHGQFYGFQAMVREDEPDPNRPLMR